ncbi:MAG: valyl-tRNA synthetase, partial [Patescibacteria group bacterium]|nr:valyl-tRNA synthetase [Patescibacteria group bacterium]
MSDLDKKIELPKAYEASQHEQDIYKTWLDSGFFNPDNLRTDGPAFTISMPPPNATGILHVGHAAGLTIQDAVTRYKRLQGYKALWVPGTDHASIATQTKVEKIIAQEGTDRNTLGREKFLERVKQYVADSQGTIREQIRRMGSSCDWSRERYTFDDGLSRAVNEAFIRMYNDGLIYRGYRIVNWCPRCASTLADDEVEYEEQNAKLYYIKYGPFVVATTRPETKLADTGVAVHPDDVRYQKYLGQILEIDLAGHKIKVKVFADSAVDPEFGSGAIGVTPAHSWVDYEFAQKNNLEIIKLIDEQGQILGTGGKYKGLSVLEARDKFVADLQASGLIEKIEDIKNNLSVCYRCQTAIEPLTSEQWFVAVDKKIPGRGKSLKELSVEVVKHKDIRIMPHRFEKTYFNWMENLHDWCISRQLWWGHRIPIWYTDDKQIIVAHDEAEARAKANGQNITQDQDTLDTWFSSSLWTFSTLGWPDNTKDLQFYHPTALMETGYDIIFFWVARMILMTEYLLGEKPFSLVYLHGIVRDKDGKKMSKSLGNGIEPIEMIEKFGADALRLSTVMGTAPGNDSRLYEEKIAGYRNFVNKLWNISRFIFSSVNEVKRVKEQPPVKTLADAWILSEFNDLVEQVTTDFHKYNLAAAGEKLYEFTWSKLADWYLELAKFEKNKDDILLYILERLLIMWHPFTPFVTEKIWQQFKPEHLIMVEHWPKAKQQDQEAVKAFAELMELVSMVRNLKAENKMRSADKPDCYIENKLLIKESKLTAAHLAGVTLQDSVVEGVKFNTTHGYFIINLHKPLQEQEVESMKKYIASLEAKLANKAFIENAPRQIVDEIRQKLEQAQKKIAP